MSIRTARATLGARCGALAPCALNPASLAFDIDGVVADTMGLFLAIARDEYGIRHTAYDDITDYHLETCLDMDSRILEEIIRRLMDGDYRQPLRPIPDAAEILTRIGSANGELLFVTARPYPGPIIHWLEELLHLDAPRLKVVSTGGFKEKLGVLREHGKSWFVEDRLETCHYLSAAGIEPIVFKQPWNRKPHDYLEVDHWQELAGLIDFA